MDYNRLGSSVHGILQARILEWVAISFSRGFSQLRDRTQVSYIIHGFFTIWATREAWGHLYKMHNRRRWNYFFFKWCLWIRCKEFYKTENWGNGGIKQKRESCYNILRVSDWISICMNTYLYKVMVYWQDGCTGKMCEYVCVYERATSSGLESLHFKIE